MAETLIDMMLIIDTLSHWNREYGWGKIFSRTSLVGKDPPLSLLMTCWSMFLPHQMSQ